MRELTETVKRVVGFAGEIVWDTTKPDGMPRKLMDSSRLFALGWRPQVDLETGIRSPTKTISSKRVSAEHSAFRQHSSSSSSSSSSEPMSLQTCHHHRRRPCRPGHGLQAVAALSCGARHRAGEGRQGLRAPKRPQQRRAARRAVLQARLAEGAAGRVRAFGRWWPFARQHAVPHEICGKLVVAADESEVPRLRDLHERGTQNGLEGLRLLDRRADARDRAACGRRGGAARAAGRDRGLRQSLRGAAEGDRGARADRSCWGQRSRRSS